MDSEDKNIKPKKRGGFIAGGGALSGLAALVGASCCVLPIVLVNIGVSAALVGELAFFARAKSYFMGLAVLLIGAAIISAFWNGRRPSKRVIVLLILSAVLVLGSYMLPLYEGHLLRWLNLR